MSNRIYDELGSRLYPFDINGYILGEVYNSLMSSGLVAYIEQRKPHVVFVGAKTENDQLSLFYSSIYDLSQLDMFSIDAPHQ